ncbi:hypothetical protein ACFQT0_23445 [Hymenobacter humi]|uniref:Uncharacterized protein n=1 Tax=Hymenobacter humi TaxID=1411620 RepID=A0ABW2U9H3_9BACT
MIAAATLLASSTSFAAAPAAVSVASHDPYDRYNDRTSKDFDYGYDKRHRVTARERERWEAAHRYDRDERNDRYDRNQNYGYEQNHRVTSAERARWETQQREAQLRAAQQREAELRAAQQREAQQRASQNNGYSSNYGYDRNHRVTPQERARWEAAHRYDHR